MKIFPFQHKKGAQKKGRGGPREKRTWDLHRLRALSRMHGRTLRRLAIAGVLVWWSRRRTPSR